MVKVLLKKVLAVFLGYGIVLAIFIVLGKILLENWETFEHKSLEIDWVLIFLATVIGLFTILFRYIIYRFILLKIDKKLIIKHNDLFKVFIYSWLARYLPGKIWLPVGKVYFGIKLGINKEKLILSSLLELILSTVANLIMAIVAFLIFFRYLYSNYELFLTLSLISILVVFSLIQRPVLIFLMNKIGKKLLKNYDLHTLIGHQDLGRIIGYYFLLTFGMSVSFLVFIMAITEINLIYYPVVMGSFVVANFLATLSFFAPAGLGVKEGVLAPLLSPLIGLPIAVKVAIFSRIFFILLDLITLLLYKANERIILSR